MRNFASFQVVHLHSKTETPQPLLTKVKKPKHRLTMFPILRLGTLLLLTALISAKEEWVHRILQKGSTADSPVGLTCRMSKEQQDKLLCACFNNRRLAHLVFRGESFFLLNHPRHRSARVLELINCSLYIGSDFFLNLASNLFSIVINGAKDLQLARNALDLEDLLSFKVRSSAMSMAIPPYTFGSTLQSIVFEQVHFAQFTTDTFRGVSSQTKVVIENSLIHTTATHHAHPTLETLELDSILLNASRFIGITEPVVALDRIKQLQVVNCTLDLYAKGAITIRQRAEQILLRDTTLNVRGEALVLRAEQIIFQNVKFIEPKQRALARLNGVSAKSELVLRNLVLIDPSKGSLVNAFPNVVFSEVIVQDGRCPCDLPQYLMADSDEFGSRINLQYDQMNNEHKKKLIKDLANSTICSIKSKKLNFSQACLVSKKLDLGYALVLLFLVAVFCVLASMALVFMVQWHRLLRRRQSILRKIDVISDAEKSREMHVKFDLEHVQFYSRPASNISTMLVHNEDAEDKPDLVKYLGHSSSVHPDLPVIKDEQEEELHAGHGSMESLVQRRTTV